MPKRTDIKTIMIIGAGPIVIGQACEFDYSGTQACKALKEEGYKVILVNSNPATIMTDPNLADKVYVEPLTVEFLKKIILREKPDAILPTVGGQTALNLALDLANSGFLDEQNIELIGANKHAIEKAENRLLFKEAMARIGLECAKNVIVKNLEEAINSLDYVGLPAIIRPSFTLGGTGSGIARTKEEYIEIVANGLKASPVNEVQIDESLLGWKEYEMEVIRDKADNCIIICSIENIDPMGVHTGDSITVAPALTLTDKEYQIMRDASLAVLREIGVDTGGSNVQFAVNPENGKMLVIEMNPRVSRSSALASKATGFPIAKIAAKLAVGYSLDELQNDCTKVTPASFEPVIDYVVTKIPRFTFEKFSETEKSLSSSMKSVGEAMAMGRSFGESLQKALRSLEIGLSGLDDIEIPDTEAEILKLLSKLTPDRILVIAQAIRKDISLEKINKTTGYDLWFLRQIKELIDAENDLIKNGLNDDIEKLWSLKSQGFSDQRIAKLTGSTAKEVMALREKHNVTPVFKTVDTCAAEFASNTPYFYSTYEGNTENEAIPTDRKKVIILGGGPNRIGQGIEFDYACVHASYALKEMGIESIMINCNPETVSTDYDTSDRLYFEPLAAEDVLAIAKLEMQKGTLLGVNIQFGGQTPLKLAQTLEDAGIPVVGTQPDAIDLAEDRERFKAFLTKLNIKQPVNFTCTSAEEVLQNVSKVGYPVVIRPSYVLGGRAMEIVHDLEDLEIYLKKYNEFFDFGPILIDSFLKNAIEVDVDAVCDGKDVLVAGIMEHIEEAGIHSGDSSCSLPPYTLSEEILKTINQHTIDIALGLGVIGLMNIQFAVKDNEVYIIEVNPRASRTVPFVAKAMGLPIAKMAAQIMAGKKLSDFGFGTQYFEANKEFFAVKESVFPFARFPGVDTILGPEMKSTGEVMGLDKSFSRAYAKAFTAAGNTIPKSGKAFISVKDSDKLGIIDLSLKLLSLGFEIVATQGTADFLNSCKIPAKAINKVRQGSPHIVDLMQQGEICLVVNTSEGKKSIQDSYSIRRTALNSKIPYKTTLSGSKAFVAAIEQWINSDLDIYPIKKYKL